jgi:hypothetical protein
MSSAGNGSRVPERIILSRKGFDQASGGCPSPVYPDGSLFSIPIPESTRHKVRTRFEDLGTQGGLRVPRSIGTWTGRKFDIDGPVHLDPDIRPSLRPSFASSKCTSALYGQDEGFQTHLDEQGVCVGDLFLFFGLFRDATFDGHDARFVPSSRKKHVIWGWLEVGNKHMLNGAIVPHELRFARHHPHLDFRARPNNCIYVGADKLSYARDVPGAGIFSKYSDALCLTANGEHRCSYWALPAFFARAGMTFHMNRQWDADGDLVRVRSVGRGQEFVIKTAGLENEVAAWLRSIFRIAGRVGA